jgi:hypothetical protein
MAEMNDKAISATIYLALEKWLDDAANKEQLPDAYYHPELIGQMTDAAVAVFMASVKSSKFTEQVHG